MRRELTPQRWEEISRQIQDPALPLDERAALRLRLFLEEEDAAPVDSPIPLARSIIRFPDIYAPGEAERLRQGCHIHEQGRVCNLSSDWEGVLRGGLLARRGASHAQDVCVDAVLAFADRLEDPALSRAVRKGAKTYREALCLLRLLHFVLWASNTYHNTLGRFDQYMYPYYQADKQAGTLTDEEALHLTKEFFLSCNRDNDLYTGMQLGDNGQSLMLGGCDREGRCAVNELTLLCLRAALENRQIDPKINLRVDRNTPLSLYEKGTELTRQGLGFPQYANDDVVIPAMIAMGYAPEDARDYTVAACWEFIIPGKGMDIPNIGAVSLADVVSRMVREKLVSCHTYEEFFAQVKQELFRRADELEASLKPLWVEPAPYQSLLMSDWRQDISLGAKYNNYGIHGTGFATAVDQLAVVKKLIFEEKSVTKEVLLTALADDFASEPVLRRTLLDAPKLGRDESCIPLADALLSAFADSWQGRRNERGGVFRAGTGSAMYYLWHGRELPATCDGRRAGEPLSANFTPSLTCGSSLPLSAVRAMARPGLNRVMNGGPLTLELHDSLFRTPEGTQKTAQLVRTFIQLGGHQLQLNAVSPETLQDAMLHPEAHRNLIVRVWGWSGRFVELDREYQDQILHRVCYRQE